MGVERVTAVLKRALVAALISAGLLGVLSASALAYTCTDNFTGPNGGLWTTGSNWSTHSAPEATAVACWPENVTIVVTETVVAVGAIHGGGLTLTGNSFGGGLDFYKAFEEGTSTLSGALTVEQHAYLSEGYTTTPAVIDLSGPLVFSGGQIRNIDIVQGPGTSVSFPAAASIRPELDPQTSITTESPVSIGNPEFEVAGGTASVTTTSTITLATGLTLPTEGDIGTFTAAGLTPNAGPTYGFGADTLNLTGGTTTVAKGTTLYSGPLNLQGGVLKDEGTVGEGLYATVPEPTPTTLDGGILEGTGTVGGALTNTAGTLTPGPLGALTVAGEYKQEAGGTLAIGIAGTTPGTGFDQLLLGGHSAILGGTLSLADEGGFAPAVGDTFKVVSGAAPREGSFAAVTGASAALYGLEYNPDGATLTTNAIPVTKAKTETPIVTSGGSPTVTGESSTGIASTPKAIEELQLGCSNAQLVLNDVYIRGSRVFLSGSAAKSLVGKQVKILFDQGKQVATATVGANGQYTTIASLPPAKLRQSLSSRYLAEIGKQRSLNLKLTRRLLLEAPKAAGTTVTLSGRVTLPLTKPIAPIAVEEQLRCGKSEIVKTITPSASGRFSITVAVPASAKAAIYRLTSKVAANSHTTKHGFATFSLPLPVVLG